MTSGSLPRATEVLALLAEGRSNGEIGDAHYITDEAAARAHQLGQAAGFRPVARSGDV